MELKFRKKGVATDLVDSSNRTFMELKFVSLPLLWLASTVLIVPLWN